MAWLLLAAATFTSLAVAIDGQVLTSARGVPCLNGVGFYRRGDNKIDPYDPVGQCSEYFECLNNRVTRYDCGRTRRFNVITGQCDYRKNVNATNCAITSKVARPLLDKGGCSVGQLACAVTSTVRCISRERFCDGTNDCSDGSDETYCTAEDDPNIAPPCDESACKLPNCFCSPTGTKIPGGLSREQTPQMVLLSFDDAVNSNVQPIYDMLFNNNNFTNPNGCPIRGTFYVSHQWTDYRLVQQLYKQGHDIGLHSVSHKRPEDYWDSGDLMKTYANEFLNNQRMLTEFAQLPGPEYFKAMRVPWLRLGGNRQYQFMKQNGIMIDHTMSAPPSRQKIWPYTLDYRMPHRCFAGNDQSCPTRRSPGSWVFPINSVNGTLLEGTFKGQYFCSMLEACPARPFDEMLKLLRDNFNAHYETNRAPIGLYFHARWFIDEGHFPALQQWIRETLASYKDVHFVTIYQAMNWIQNPVPVSGNLAAFDCPSRSSVPDICSAESAFCGELPGINSESPAGTFSTCRGSASTGKRCPPFYPWIGNWRGETNTYEAGVPTAAPLPPTTTTSAPF